jgi:hypothetical protein
VSDLVQTAKHRNFRVLTPFDLLEVRSSGRTRPLVLGFGAKKLGGGMARC